MNGIVILSWNDFNTQTGCLKSHDHFINVYNLTNNQA
jgi:hypothetical protein